MVETEEAPALETVEATPEPNWTESRTLYEPITEERRLILSEELANDYRDLEDTREAKKESDAVFNSRIKSLEGKCSRKAQTLNDGKEDTGVSVGWWLDFGAGVKRCRRIDTMEIIETRALTSEEKQVQLKLEEDAHPDDAEAVTASADEPAKRNGKAKK